MLPSKAARLVVVLSIANVIVVFAVFAALVGVSPSTLVCSVLSGALTAASSGLYAGRVGLPKESIEGPESFPGVAQPDGPHLDAATARSTDVDEGDAAVRAVHEDAARTAKIVSEVDGYNDKLADRLETVTKAVMSIVDRTAGLRRLIEAQTAGVNEISASVEQMAGTVRTVHGSADHATAAASSMLQTIAQSNEAIATTTKHMDRVLGSIGIVRRFTATIVDIAERTNLLAINASIEAAHSGHDGRGFAVIAGEIRRLAENSNAEASEAENALSGVIADVERTSEFLLEMESIMQNLRVGADKVANLVDQIRGAIGEQEVGTQEIVSAVTELSDTSVGVESDYVAVDASMEEVQFSFIEISNLAKNTQGAVRKADALLARLQETTDRVSSDNNSMSA